MDPDNIFHIIMGNQDPAPDAPQAPSNVLQGAPPAPDAPQAPSNVLQSVAPPQALPAPQDVAQAAVAASPPVPKPRRSLLDTIGRISDVLATVGGAQALYQPTLDAARNRLRQVDLDKLDLATKQAALTASQNTNGDSERERFGNVLGAVNDAEDAANLPAMMQTAGLTDPKYAPFIKMIQDDPEKAKTLAAALGGGGDDTAVKYGGNIIYGKDANGTIHAYQANITGGSARDVLPEGITPVDPQQFIDTGGAHVGVGKLSGLPKIVLPNTEKPGFKGGQPINEKPGFSGGEPIKEKPGFSGGRPIAPAPGKPGASNGFTAYNEARSGLTDVSNQIDTILNDQDALNAGTGARGFVERHIPGTAAQRLLGNIATLKGQALATAVQHLKALSSGGNLGFRLTQQEANAFSQQMAGALENTGQSSTDYATNLRGAQGRIKSMISRLDQDAARNNYTQAPASGGNAAAIAEARRRGLIH